MKNKRGAEIIKIYTPPLWMKLLLGFLTTVMLGFHFPALLWASQTTTEFPNFIFIFLIPLYAGLLWYTIMLCTQTRLIVYEDGLEIQRGGSRFFSPWDNMSHFARRGMGRNSKYGIVLFESVQPEVIGLAEKLIYGWSSDFMYLSEIVHLPRHWGLFGGTINTEKLLDSEFGREIYQFAPHLFRTVNEKAKNG